MQVPQQNIIFPKNQKGRVRSKTKKTTSNQLDIESSLLAKIKSLEKRNRELEKREEEGTGSGSGTGKKERAD